MLRLTYTT